MLDNILINFGLDPSQFKIQPFGTGLINHTLKLSGNADEYILQKINGNVFKSPAIIADNLALLQAYFTKMHPDYLFVGPLPTTTGKFLIHSSPHEYYRLFPFVKGSKTIDFISDQKQAYEAARQFGKFTNLLNDFDATKLRYTLVDFHNLNLRFDQFKAAYKSANTERPKEAADEIKEVYNLYNILQNYNQLIGQAELPVRVIHHDTKISNILFDSEDNGLCVIDLDTVMPGYYLSDVGDMMRTYLSPANEEESDLSKIYIREDIFKAICKGYIQEMGKTLTEAEKLHFIFSGKMMIYMQAIRFLTDFLNNDTYYEVKYPGQNLVRAKNQFNLLKKYILAEEELQKIFKSVQSELLETTKT